jgi:TPP-dependent pyruvate/acetoin dehydrogenase alpha subunit
MNFTSDEQLRLFRDMVRGRMYDAALNEMCRKAQVPGMWHSALGHEATHAGAAAFLRQDDWLGQTHRGITALLAKGLDARMCLAEHLGRSGGYAKGKGGHFCGDKEHGVLPVTLTVGGTFPIATGAGIAAKNAGRGQVVVSIFGEGAAQRGTLHECMNMASAWRLPVIWVCENNLYYITTHVKDALAVEKVSEFAPSYNMPGVTVDGMDVIAVAEAVAKAVERARAGEGPSLVECRTYRFREHGEFDIDTSYRTKREVEAWRSRDPVEAFRRRLVESETVGESSLESMATQIEAEVKGAVEWALATPEPALEQAFTDLYSE